MFRKLVKKFKKGVKRLAVNVADKIDEESILELMDLATANIKKKHRKKGDVLFVYPAEMCKCLRLAYYKYKNEEETVVVCSPTTQAGNIFDRGLKELITDVCKELKIVRLIRDFPISYVTKYKRYKVVISGSADFASHNAILELKSSLYKELEPNEVDKLQTGFYTKVMELNYKRPFDGYILVFYRNVFYRGIYKLNREEIERGFLTVLENSKKLIDHLRKGIEPEPKPLFWCVSCPLLSSCEEGKKYVKEVMKRDVNYIISRIKKYEERYKKILDKLE